MVPYDNTLSRPDFLADDLYNTIAESLSDHVPLATVIHSLPPLLCVYMYWYGTLAICDVCMYGPRFHGAPRFTIIQNILGRHLALKSCQKLFRPTAVELQRKLDESHPPKDTADEIRNAGARCFLVDTR